MAKVHAPLHSLAATGTVGDLITFRHGRAVHVAHKKPRASGSNTAAQAAHRAAYSAGCAAWQALSPAERASWRAVGAAQKITGFNAFMSDYLLNPPAPAGGWEMLTADPAYSLSVVSGMSQDGTVIAGATSGNTPDIGWYWTLAGGIAPLPELYAGNQMFTGGVAASGSHLCGWTNDGTANRAWVSTVGGAPQDIGILPGGTLAQANAISSGGTAACGTADDADGGQAFHWTPAGGMQKIPPLMVGGPMTARAISADGLTVWGYGFDGAGYAPFWWDNATGIHTLPPQAGLPYIMPVWSSPDGATTAGVCTDGATYWGFVADKTGAFTKLPDYPDAAQTYATGMTADLQTTVVGIVTPAGNIPVLWNATTGYETLALPAGATGATTATISGDGHTIAGTIDGATTGQPAVYRR